MGTLEIVIAVAAGVILFLFGIENFSREVQSITGARFRKALATSTKNRFAGFALGAAVTAVIQSSTATSVIAVGLVNAGVLSFRNSLGILFGANVGTTVTAQLVALELTSFAPLLILFGFVLGALPLRWKILGRSIFFFGLVFFSLNLVSAAVSPLKNDPEVLALLAKADSRWMGVVMGAGFTAIVQSSSVTTGLAIVLIQQGMLPLETGVALVLGANVGTTVTALIASAQFDTSARRTAISHAGYNIAGVLLFLPFLTPFEMLLGAMHLSQGQTLAMAHLIFNVVCGALFLGVARPFGALVERLIRDDDASDPLEPPPEELDADFDSAVQQIHDWTGQIVRLLEPAYTASVLALQTRDRKIENRAARLVAIVDFGLEEGRGLIQLISQRELSSPESHQVLHLVMTLDNIGQMTDSFEDLNRIQEERSRRAKRFSVDALLDIQRIYPMTAKLIGLLVPAQSGDPSVARELHALDARLATALSECHLRFIELARTETEGSELADFLSIHQRLRSKIGTFAEHLLVDEDRPSFVNSSQD